MTDSRNKSSELLSMVEDRDLDMLPSTRHSARQDVPGVCRTVKPPSPC